MVFCRGSTIGSPALRAALVSIEIRTLTFF